MSRKKEKPRPLNSASLVRLEALGAAHNLGNFIGTILLRTELLLKKVRDPHLLSEIEGIQLAAREASAIVERLISRKSLRAFQKKEWIDLNQLISTLIERVKPGCIDPSGKAKILIQFKPLFLPKVQGWASLLSEAFMNLILNAIEAVNASDRREILIQTAVCHSHESHVWRSGNLSVLIRDSGVGMSQQTAQHLFEPFFTTKKEKGHGLGLSLSRQLIEKHGGSLEIESSEGKGTTVCVMLPLPVKRGVDRSKKIMLIDDEKDYREATAELLSLEGYEVDQAENGFEALKKMKKKDFDVVLSDFHMPKLSAEALLKKVKAENKNTKVIFVSGFHQKKAIKADGWLMKPCLVEDISEAIRRTCH